MPRDRPSRIAAPSSVRAMTELDHDAESDEPSADLLADEAEDLTNGDLSRALHEIGDILEVQGEIAFKTIAYHRAADAIGHSPIALVAAYRAGTAPKIAGIGS